MKKYLLLTFITFNSYFLISCSAGSNGGTGNTSLPSLNSGNKGGQDTSDKFSLSIQTNWEGGTVRTTHASCSVPYTATTGSSHTCTASVPEAQLFFSDLNFVISIPSKDYCAQVSFCPYYYVKSNDVAFTAPGDTTATDCSVSPLNTKCYGGAAPYVTPSFSFPTYTCSYVLPSNTSSITYKVPSENGNRTYGGNSVNYKTTNNLTDRTSAIVSSPRTFIGGSGNFVDYRIICSDKWGSTKHSMTITVSDYNISDTGDATDDYLDWQ